MVTNPVRQAQLLGQSIWYDNIRRGLIESGELQRLIDVGVTGLTSNPTIFEKAITQSTDYDEALLELARQGRSAEEIFEALAIEDIQTAADLLRPIFDSTDGADGYASLEVSPHLARDTERSVEEAKRLFAKLDRPNALVKIPATPEGIPAVRRLIGDGVNVNVTLIFSLDTYRQVREAYLSGLEDLAESDGDVSKVASVASFFVSRVDTAVDALLDESIRQGRQELVECLGKAAVANAKLAYRDSGATFGGERFAPLRAKGARVQRPLWASTSTKNPAYSDLLYVESLMGPDTVNTMPEVTITSFLEHGVAGDALERDVEEAELTLHALEEAGISMEQVTARLLAEGVRSFADSFDSLLANIEEKRTALLATDRKGAELGLGKYLPDVNGALDELQRRDVAARIWGRDHTVWKREPAGISDRLGWLTITDIMRNKVPSLEAFADEIRSAAFRHVVLIGMGGSSLGPSVLRGTFGVAPGHPDLVVMDSTLPDRVREVTGAIDPARTLFLVSSKSGGTIEPSALYKHFRGVVEQVVGREQAGLSFAAITDSGTPLDALAKAHRFRRTFLNPPDVGGRYSVLSYFGLVPAALMGIDTTALLDRADDMRLECGPSVPTSDNPGAWLGATIGALALRGRDKLTLVTSPSLSTFGVWVEQLIAESMGKQGRGVVPVEGEPLVDPRHYGDDRLFCYLRLEGDHNAETDAAVDRIEGSGQPVIRLKLKDRYDLGGEFFRWEFATAVAGSVFGIHPFGQHYVDETKQLTESVLRANREPGRLPGVEGTPPQGTLLADVRPGDYVAIMAYTCQTPEIEQLFGDLRRAVMERYNIATTLGYGPALLHSTGQLHKGGPNTGVFLQITTRHAKDLPIPGEAYTFGALADAQALGDLQALKRKGRRIARLQLDAEGAEALRVAIGRLAG